MSKRLFFHAVTLRSRFVINGILLVCYWGITHITHKEEKGDNIF